MHKTANPDCKAWMNGLVSGSKLHCCSMSSVIPSSLSHVIRLLDIIEVLQCVDKTCRFFPRRCWKCLFFARRYQLVLFIQSCLVALQSDEKTAGVANEVFPHLQRWSAVWSRDVMLRFKADVGYTHSISRTSAVSLLDDPIWSRGQMLLFYEVAIFDEFIKCELYGY